MSKSRTRELLEAQVRKAVEFAKESNLDVDEIWQLDSVKRLRRLATEKPAAGDTDECSKEKTPSAKTAGKEDGDEPDGGKQEKRSSSSSLSPPFRQNHRRRKRPGSIIGNDGENPPATAAHGSSATRDDRFQSERRDVGGPQVPDLKNLSSGSSSTRFKNKGVATLLLASMVAVAFAFQEKGSAILSEAVGLRFFGHPSDYPCAISMPGSWKDKVRPPVDCAICEGLTSVDRVSGLNPERFFSEYVENGRPAVVTDAMANWTATEHFSYDFFRTLYTDVGDESDESDGPRRSRSFADNFEDAGCQFFPYKTEFQSLREVFSMDEDRAAQRPGHEPWYVGWGSCDVEVNEILRQYYQRPYFLPRTSEGTKMDWIFMGTSGFGAHMHVDHVRHPSWQAQIKGRKLWSLQPPPECYFRCSDMDVTVEPGEIIVLDTNRWYHSTRVISEDISITIGSEFD